MSGLPGAVRPTVRCVREDLGYPKLPPATLALDRLDAPVLRKAREVCRTDPPSTGRIASIDDRVLWKVKIERWRGADDEDRIALEQAAAAVDEIRAVVAELVLSSATTSAEQSDEAGGCSIAVLVRRTEHEVYVGIRISGPVRENVTAVILAAVPAVADPAGWFLDVMPGRSDNPGELVWSNLLDPAVLDQLLYGDSAAD